MRSFLKWSKICDYSYAWSGCSFRNDKRKIFLSNRMIYHIYENAGKQLMKKCRRTDLLKAKKCFL